MFLCCLIINLMTQVTSNSSTMMIFAALLCDMAENLAINPMYLIVPCAASVSMAFCLPVSTPPNAVVFEYGKLVHYYQVIKFKAAKFFSFLHLKA